MGCLLLLCYVLSMYYLLQKFREYVLNSNRMARLQAKYDHIRMTLGDQSNQPNEGQSTLSRRPNVNRRYVVLQYICDSVDRQWCQCTPPRTPRISGLKSQVLKSSLEFFHFEILLAPSVLPANLPGQFSLSGQTFLHWAAAIMKGLVEFQNEKF